MGCGSEEDDMSDTTPALDEAFERMAAASFELPNGFVNHGAMACEALAMLDCTDDIDSWARRFAAAGGALVDPAVPAGFDWRQALGDYHRLPEWIGYFTQAIDDDGWPAVVATWVPRRRVDRVNGPHGVCGPDGAVEQRGAQRGHQPRHPHRDHRRPAVVVNGLGEIADPLAEPPVVAERMPPLEPGGRHRVDRCPAGPRR